VAEKEKDMGKLGIGIIGCGWVCDMRHFHTFARNRDKVEVLGLCDVERGRAESAKERFGFDNAIICEDYKELLKRDDIECVYVLTPNNLHKKPTLDAFAAGKHVFCEKPIATTRTDAEEMLEASTKAGKQFTTGHQWRYSREHLYIKSLCENGNLGDIYYAKASDMRYRTHPTWGSYHSKEINGGGIMMDGAPHALDMTLWFMDNLEVESVRGTVSSPMRYACDGNVWGPWDPNYDVEDTGFALITMRNGATVFLEAAWASNLLDQNTSILCGTKGGVDMGGPKGVRFNQVINGHKVVSIPDDFPSETFAESLAFACDYELDHWIESIRDGVKPLCTPESAVVVASVLEAIYKSNETGQTTYL
jgi:predicted dehydrogenase